VLPLAVATLDYIPDSPTAAPYRRQWAFDLNRRAVEISVKFLGATTRQAVEANAARLSHTTKIFDGRASSTFVAK
jgi:hypothetical protein